MLVWGGWYWGMVKGDSASFDKNNLESHRRHLSSLEVPIELQLEKQQAGLNIPLNMQYKENLSRESIQSLSLAKQSPLSTCFTPQIPNAFSMSLGNLKIAPGEEGVGKTGGASC